RFHAHRRRSEKPRDVPAFAYTHVGTRRRFRRGSGLVERSGHIALRMGSHEAEGRTSADDEGRVFERGIYTRWLFGRETFGYSTQTIRAGTRLDDAGNDEHGVRPEVRYGRTDVGAVCRR